MPLTTDEKLLALSRETIEVIRQSQWRCSSRFPARACQGVLLTGMFTPSPEAASLTRAPHASGDSTPVTVRFSDFAGIPTVPDNDPQDASPRGLRHPLPPRRACSYRHRGSFGRHVPSAHRGGIPGVPQCVDCHRSRRAAPECDRAVSGRASRGSDIRADSQADSDQLCAGSRSSQYPHSSSPTRTAVSRYGRYRVLPVAGNEYWTRPKPPRQRPNFLFDEIKERVAQGPGQVSHRRAVGRGRRHH